MLRLAPRGNLRLLQEQYFEATFGGGEANVAVSLAQFGLDSAYLTLLPTNDIGLACTRELRGFGVDTSPIVTKPGRIGVYFVEPGSNMRPSKVIYDRADSVIATAQLEDVDFTAAFSGRDWLHVTGITPAISSNGAELTREAVRVAKQLGLTVSCDLNYRSSLWKYGVEPQSVMSELVPFVDVLIANEEDIQKMLGLEAAAVDVSSGELDTAEYQQLAETVFTKYPQLRLVATTLRESKNANQNDWAACVFDGSQFLVSRKYSITDIVDRVGGGDSFAAGFIYGLNELSDLREALEFAVAASALNHTIRGDFNRVSPSEVLALMGGDTSGRVKR